MFLKKHSLISSLLWAGFLIPLDQASQWQSLQFSSIPANKVSHSSDKLTINVNKSASPLIYPFKESKSIKSVSARFTVEGNPFKFKEKNTQGSKGNDDFVFRLGLVKKGDKTLNWMQRQVAAPWVLKMHSLATKGSGIDSILFLTAVQQKKLIGQSRVHPLSEYFIEEYLVSAEPGKEVHMEKSFDQNIDVVGLWISADGDQTQAKFKVTIKELLFNYK